jgi:hypothetical protein
MTFTCTYHLCTPWNINCPSLLSLPNEVLLCTCLLNAYFSSLNVIDFIVLVITGNVLLIQYCAGGKIKKNEMGWACGAYGGGESCAQGFGGEA